MEGEVRERRAKHIHVYVAHQSCFLNTLWKRKSMRDGEDLHVNSVKFSVNFRGSNLI